MSSFDKITGDSLQLETQKMILIELKIQMNVIFKASLDSIFMNKSNRENDLIVYNLNQLWLHVKMDLL